MNLDTPIESLPKVGSTTAKALHQLGIFNVQDLLFHFPYRYLDYRKTLPIRDITQGEIVTIKGTLKDIKARFSFRSRLSVCEAVITDETGSLKIVWFNQGYLAKSLKKGGELLLSGKVDRYKSLQLTNPVYEKVGEEAIHTSRLVPVYHSTETVPNRTLRNLVHLGLAAAEQIEDLVPNDIRQKENLLPISEAVNYLHFPTGDEAVKKARFRIAFDDVFPQQLAVGLRQAQMANMPSYQITADIELVKSFLATLPFQLTASQKRAAWDIFQDMASPAPMNRLLQGDVGSGKTLVALLAALQVANQNLQTAFLAPTEILARQHYTTIEQYLRSYPSQVGLLTRNFAEIDGAPVSKKEYLEKLNSGALHITIGTHALIQESVGFKNLALAIIDEQHRFGVAQRSFLGKQKIRPHLLSMSATPIPRTLALSLYGDLAVSTLNQVPSGRKPIITKIVAEAARAQAYKFVQDQVASGRQAFIITPRVEDNEKSAVRSAKAEFKRLAEQVFPKLKVGLVYGKMKGAEKDSAMNSFSEGKIDILVATSVIEIGIDVPNATAIIIEGAERFGLAQLHQLRGRVGRGEHQSYCFLFTTEDLQSENERLQIFSKSTDGFALAELDLKQRGFGDLFGKQQTGFAFRFPQFITIPALKAAREGAVTLLKKDAGLSQHPVLRAQAESYLEDYHGE